MQLLEVDRFVDVPLGTADSAVPTFHHFDATTEPDCCWQLQDGAKCPSRCALWWRNTPSLPGHRVGLVGCFAALEADAAKTLLGHACSQLRSEGCTLAVGPMDGNTWGNYRFITEFGDRECFWMEPKNPPQWPAYFEDSGFRPLANYFSAVNAHLQTPDPRLGRASQRLEAIGVHLRPLCADRFDGDLRQIYDVARQVFRPNLLYSDMPSGQFRQQGLQLRELVPLQLSWVAEHQGQIVGFLFAIPDLCERALGKPIQTIVIKTLAVLPRHAYAGLGQLLLAKVQQHAYTLGFNQAIHALVRDVPSLRKISTRQAQPMRRYTLYSKVLAS